MNDCLDAPPSPLAIWRDQWLCAFATRRWSRCSRSFAFQEVSYDVAPSWGRVIDRQDIRVVERRVRVLLFETAQPV